MLYSSRGEAPVHMHVRESARDGLIIIKSLIRGGCSSVFSRQIATMSMLHLHVGRGIGIFFFSLVSSACVPVMVM